MNDKIMTRPKELIMPDGTIKSFEEKPKYTTPDGQVIDDPVVVSKADFERVMQDNAVMYQKLRMLPVMRDMIILLRAAVDNELQIMTQRNNLGVPELGIRGRLQDVLETVDKTLGTGDMKIDG